MCIYIYNTHVCIYVNTHAYKTCDIQHLSTLFISHITERVCLYIYIYIYMHMSHDTFIHLSSLVMSHITERVYTSLKLLKRHFTNAITFPRFTNAITFSAEYIKGRSVFTWCIMVFRGLPTKFCHFKKKRGKCM